MDASLLNIAFETMCRERIALKSFSAGISSMNDNKFFFR